MYFKNLKVSKKNVLEILKSGPELKTPKKNKNRQKPVTGIDDFASEAIRRLIYEMKESGINCNCLRISHNKSIFVIISLGAHVTIQSVQELCKEREICSGSISSIRRMIKSAELNFTYRKSDFRDKWKQNPENQAWKRCNVELQNHYVVLFFFYIQGIPNKILQAKRIWRMDLCLP